MIFISNDLHENMIYDYVKLHNSFQHSVELFMQNDVQSETVD